jgi:integrase
MEGITWPTDGPDYWPATPLPHADAPPAPAAPQPSERTPAPDGRPFWRSDLSAPAVARWLATRTSLVQKRGKAAHGSRRRPDPTARPISGGTKRKYLAAVQSFAKCLLEVGVLDANPLRDLSPPPAADPRCHFLELPDVLRVVEGAAQPLRAIYALAYGAGLEVSAILRLVDADVDPAARQVRARGTKSWTRDRLARVADWAWPWVAEHVATVLPGERVFRGLDRWAVGEAHRQRLRALGLEGYRLHDARHHWAVRMARAGAVRAHRPPARAPRRRDGGEGVRSLQAGHGGARSVGKDRCGTRRRKMAEFGCQGRCQEHRRCSEST